MDAHNTSGDMRGDMGRKGMARGKMDGMAQRRGEGGISGATLFLFPDLRMSGRGEAGVYSERTCLVLERRLEEPATRGSGDDDGDEPGDGGNRERWRGMRLDGWLMGEKQLPTSMSWRGLTVLEKRGDSKKPQPWPARIVWGVDGLTVEGLNNRGNDLSSMDTGRSVCNGGEEKLIVGDLR